MPTTARRGFRPAFSWPTTASPRVHLLLLGWPSSTPSLAHFLPSSLLESAPDAFKQPWFRGRLPPSCLVSPLFPSGTRAPRRQGPTGPVHPLPQRLARRRRPRPRRGLARQPAALGLRACPAGHQAPGRRGPRAASHRVRLRRRPNLAQPAPRPHPRRPRPRPARQSRRPSRADAELPG